MKFKTLRNQSPGSGTSLKNLLWIMRQYENLEPYSKEIVREFVITGELPADWTEIVTRSHEQHLAQRPSQGGKGSGYF